MGHGTRLDRAASGKARSARLSPLDEARWHEVKDVLADAIEKTADERTAFLAALERKDPELAREVTSLLGWYPGVSSAATPPAGRQARLVAGTRLGAYEIEDVLDSGGMGVVYRARDTRLHRLVAIKVVDASGDGPGDAARRFEREAKAIAAIAHPNVLEIFDYGHENGVAYAVVELLTGENLRTRLRRGALDRETALDVARQIAQGLEAAHAKDMVHRDLKPENVFLGSNGTAKILDFGLAKRSAIDVGTKGTLATRAGVLLGTIGYMSPEQIRGQGVDGRADVFALGVVLHEMLTGSRPFDRDTPAETLAAVLRDEPAFDDPRLPADVISALRQCLAKEPGARYPTVHRLLDAIAELQASSGPRVWPRRAALAAVAGLLVGLRYSTTRHGPSVLEPDFVARVGRLPNGLAFSEEDVYVANRGSNSVTRVDRKSGSIRGTFAVGEQPNALAYRNGTLWVANHGWLTGGYSTLMQMDAVDGRILSTYRLPGQPIFVMTLGDFVWVTETWPTYVLRKLRASDGHEIGVYTAGGVPRNTATDGKSIWVSNGPIGAITEIEANDGKLVGSLAIEGGPNYLRYVAGHVWVHNDHPDPGRAALFRVRPGPMKVTARFSTRNMRACAVSERWFFCGEGSRVHQWRVEDGSLAADWSAGSDAGTMEYDGEHLWIADYAAGELRRVSGNRLAEASRT